MHRIPWRRKGKKGNKIREATKPGQCVSVDQMEPITLISKKASNPKEHGRFAI